MSLMKTACLSGAVAVAFLTVSAGAQTGVFFQDAWERNVGTGCDFTKISDASAWTDYGPSTTCSASPHVADIVNNEKVEGNQSLRVNFTPDGSGNGPDFRIVKAFGTGYTEIYARWYTKWSNNWVWASGDHKVAIFGNAAQTSQDVYYNIRGNGGGGPSGRVAIHVIPTDTVLSDPSVVVTPGVWHLCEIHIVSGTNGRVEAKIDGRLLNLRTEAGNTANPGNLNTGSNVGFIKLDTTYNIYSYPSSLGLYMNMWYDGVGVGTAGWLGGIGGTTTSGPSAPSNLRIVS